MAEFSKSQIDRLGERLRKGPQTEADLRMLDEYRRSFGAAYGAVIEVLRRRSQSFLRRPEKTTPSIVAKLQRGNLKLSQMQDIAGCRIVVSDRFAQDELVDALRKDLREIASREPAVKDRRDEPSFGYRAVHLIPMISGKRVEIQIRSILQHRWAELSEKAFDIIDPRLKYGGGPPAFQQLLANWSSRIAEYELQELGHVVREAERHDADALKGVIESAMTDTERIELARRREQISLTLSAIMRSLHKMTEDRNP